MNDGYKVVREYTPKGGIYSNPDSLTVEITLALLEGGYQGGGYIKGNGSVPELLEEWNQLLRAQNPPMKVEIYENTILVYIQNGKPKRYGI